MTNVVQVRLRSGTTHLTCYVEDIVKPGYSIQLKDDPNCIWIVDSIDSEPVDLRTINRKWTNNI